MRSSTIQHEKSACQDPPTSKVVKVKDHIEHYVLTLLAQQDIPCVDCRQSNGVAVGVESTRLDHGDNNINAILNN